MAKKVETRNPNCEDCGQWYAQNTDHECTTEVPLTISAPLAKYGLSLDKIVFDLVSCDSGAGMGWRDYQMEMCSAQERRAVFRALKEHKGLRFQYFGE